MPRRLLNLVVLIPFALTLRANTAPAATDFAAGPTKAGLAAPPSASASNRSAAPTTSGSASLSSGRSR